MICFGDRGNFTREWRSDSGYEVRLPPVPPEMRELRPTASVGLKTDESAKSGDARAMPGPPPPAWRNDSANVAITAAFNDYLRLTPFSNTHDGAITDAQPVRLDWSIIGDMPHAMKDGHACWMAPDSAHPEGEVLIAGGLWPTGIAHLHWGTQFLNRSYSFDVARRQWTPLPLPPLVPGRTQGACLKSSLVIISGADGGTVGPRVMRLSKSAGGRWTWDTRLPPLPADASRMTAAAHSIGERWLVIGLGAPGPAATPTSALASYRLDLEAKSPQWQLLPPHPLTIKSKRQLSVPISAVAGGKWLVFGGQYQMDKDDPALQAWNKLPDMVMTQAVFGPRPSGSTIDVRDAFAYDPATNRWEALPKMPLNFVQGPKLAPVVGGRYVLLLGAQRRLTARQGSEPPGYMAAVGRPTLEGAVEYYGDDACFYDTVEQVYGSLGKIPCA